jgi:NADH-quinone oxidoreductase subunit M
MTFPILTSIVVLPVLAAVLLLFIENRDDRRAGVIRQIALVSSLLVFALTLVMWAQFDPRSAEFQLVERYEWIPAFGIDYFIGVDGISLLLVVLTGFLTPSRCCRRGAR